MGVSDAARHSSDALHFLGLEQLVSGVLEVGKGLYSAEFAPLEALGF